jgi:5-methylcytosine-specific restriction endonuclease McrA
MSAAISPATGEGGGRQPKERIPRALREQVWIAWAGRRFERRCLVPWCRNVMTVFDFHVGHNIPESKGGATELANLRPICARCNLSMGSQYSIEEWGRLSAAPVGCWCW